MNDISGALSAGGEVALEALKAEVGDSIADDMEATAAHNYDEDPGKYTGDGAVKALADATFSDYKGFKLRDKIGFGADIAYSISETRTYMRGFANDAAAAEIKSVTTGSANP